MAKLKIGDKVKVLKDEGDNPEDERLIGRICTISDVDEDEKSYPYCLKESDSDNCWGDKELKKVTNFRLKFLLIYMRDEDPREEFQTLAEVEKRIIELAEDEEVQQDSFEVFEIKKKFSVKLIKKVILT